MNPDLEAAEAVYVLSCREVVCGSNLPYVFLSFLASCFLLPVFTSFLGSRNLSWWGPELVMVGLVEKGSKRVVMSGGWISSNAVISSEKNSLKLKCC